jgi:hypothetical protein
VAIVVMAPFAGRIAGARGSGLPIAVGTAMAGSALLLLRGLEADTDYRNIWWKFALFGGGLGLVLAPMAAAAVAGMPRSQAGLASGVLNTSRQVGGAVGIALLGTVLANRFRAALPPEVRANVGRVAGGFQAAGPAVRRVVADAFVAGLRTGYLLGGTALLTCTVLAATLLGAFRGRPAGPPPAEPEAAMASSGPTS